MGSIANQITAPLGIKAFPGAPYPDAGNTDKALASAAPLKKTGTDLLGAGQTGLFDLFGLNPKTDTNPDKTGWAGTPGFGQQQNPYNLNATDMGAFNLAAGPINAARKTALESAKAHLSSSGLSHSGAKALEEYINQSAETDLSSKYQETVQASFQRKLQTFLQMLQLGSGMLGQNINANQVAAQGARQDTNQAHSDLFSAIGAGFAGANALGGNKAGGAQTIDPALFQFLSMDGGFGA